MTAMGKSVLAAFGLLIVLEFGCIVALKGTVSELAISVRALNASVDRLIERTEANMPGQLYASWYSAGSPPILREVTTTRMEGETVRSWEDRHDAAVASLRTTYPPV